MTSLGHFPQNSAKTAKNLRNAKIPHRIPHFADNSASVGILNEPQKNKYGLKKFPRTTCVICFLNVLFPFFLSEIRY